MQAVENLLANLETSAPKSSQNSSGNGELFAKELESANKSFAEQPQSAPSSQASEQRAAERTPEKQPERTPEKQPERVAEKQPEKPAERVAEKQPEAAADGAKQPQNSAKTSEAASEQASQPAASEPLKEPLSAAALVAAAKKLPAKRLKKGAQANLLNALKVSEHADSKELLQTIKKLNAALENVLKKLDAKIEQTAAAAAKEPSALALLLGGKSAKIDKLINEANELNAALPKRLQISKAELLESIKAELQNTPDYGAELLEDLQFSKLLDLAQTLKSGGQAPDLSKLFALKIPDEARVAASAKNASSVQALLAELGEELNVSKLTAERVAAGDFNPQIFADKFPKLYEKNFFSASILAAASVKKALAAASKDQSQTALALKAADAPATDISALKGGALARLLKGSSELLEATEQKLAAVAEKQPDANDFGEQKSAGGIDLKANFLSGKKLNAEQTRGVMQTFAQDFKDELAKFKAPLHRVSIALKPAELGEINVTMLARGNNLQVNLHSANASTMQLFMQNQAEIRTALVNMGFTGLSMNFSGGEQQQRQGEQQKGAKGGDAGASGDEIESADEGLNLTLERYLV